MAHLRLLAKFINRNPRNIEQLGLQTYPAGYGMDVDRHKHSFIYRADFRRHRQYVEGHIVHYKEGTVLTASSRENQLFAQLCSPSDISACANIGHVLGLRCAMAGIHFLQDIDMEDIKKSAHVSAFFGALIESGIKFGEPQPIPHTFEVDSELTYDNYEIRHTREDNTD
ncbi:unnamed protein product [Cercopithifilaria johnstoni]|uniref:Uncharacterized protein n=1 Tax=Cercopithifilaria johnstoni TaxID=2874296 RepID=A0A8J2Q3M0_9BILA|nr:unnamed protein product [Cercopithifilaria johnstoni]